MKFKPAKPNPRWEDSARSSNPATHQATVWKHGQLATMNSSISSSTYGLIDDGALVAENGKIVWLGQTADLPQKWQGSDCQHIDLEHRLVTPGLIDCHTHLVYAGQRASEFEMRLLGRSYSEIANKGGGILSTVTATRQATAQELKNQTQLRLEQFLAQGITTLEIKSGYGLDYETERRCLALARELALEYPVDIVCTFLGAHTLPPEYSGNKSAYMVVLLEMFQKLHALGLVDAVDAFCEKIAFEVHDLVPLFDLAKAYGIPIKLHAEQLSDSEGAIFASQYGALSCDHLEYLSEKGVQSLANHGTVAVLLPVAFYFLREQQLPPIELLRKYQVPMAVSTDCNPGTSPCTSILLALNMACTLFRLTPEEALKGVTIQAAKALGKSDRGILAPNMRADLAIWTVEQAAELCYACGQNPLYQRIYSSRT